METGTSKEDEVSLTQRIGTHTGGIRTSSTMSFKHSKDRKVNRKPNDFVSKLFIRGKAVQDKIPELLNIMIDVLTDCNFGNQQRILEMLKESKARMRFAILAEFRFGNQSSAERWNDLRHHEPHRLPVEGVNCLPARPRHRFLRFPKDAPCRPSLPNLRGSWGRLHAGNGSPCSLLLDCCPIRTAGVVRMT